MKYISARIKPHKFDAVREELAQIGIENITVSEVKDYGRYKGHTELYRGTEHRTGFSILLKLEMIIPKSNTDIVVELVKTSAYSGDMDDGEIMVLDMDQLVSIRTQEMLYNTLPTTSVEE